MLRVARINGRIVRIALYRTFRPEVPAARSSARNLRHKQSARQPGQRQAAAAVGAFVAHWAGDATAGEFEIPSIGVGAAAEDGRMQRSDLYGPDQLEEAWARFAALGGPSLGATSARRPPRW